MSCIPARFTELRAVFAHCVDWKGSMQVCVPPPLSFTPCAMNSVDMPLAIPTSSVLCACAHRTQSYLTAPQPRQSHQHNQRSASQRGHVYMQRACAAHHTHRCLPSIGLIALVSFFSTPSPVTVFPAL